MKYISYIIIIAFAIGFSSLNASDNYRFEHITTDDGLVNGYISDIFQDSRGYIWIATLNGLSRFDGYSFLNLYSNNSCNNCLSSQAIHYITEDNKGNLFVGTENGLDILNFKTGKWKNYLVDSSDNHYSYANIRTIYIGKKNTVWLGTYGKGIIQFNLDTKQYSRVKLVENEPEELMINDFYLDSDSNYWFSCEDFGIIYYNTKSGIGKHFSRYSAKDKSFDHFTVNSVLEYKKDTFCIATMREGVYFFDKKSESFFKQKTFKDFVQSSPESISVMDMIIDNDNLIWMATYGNGLIVYNPLSEESTISRHDISDPSSISNDYLVSISLDNSNNIWVGTLGQGISKFNMLNNNFRVIQSGFRVTNDVLTMYQGLDDMVLLGTRDGGIHIYDVNNSRIIPFSDGLSDDLRIFDFETDEQNNFWLAAQGELYYYNTKTKTSVRYINKSNPDNSLEWGRLFSLEIDYKGNLWVACLEDGLYCLEKSEMKKSNPEKAVFKKYKPNSLDSTSLSTSMIFKVLETPDSNLWIGSYRGLINYNRERDNFKQVAKQYIISTFTYDDNGNIWASTRNNGIIKVNYANFQITNFGQDKGLLDNNIHSLVFENDSILWYSCARGIGRFNIKTSEFNNFYFGKSVGITNFTRNASLKLINGEIIFGGSNGLIVFDPKKLSVNKSSFHILFTDFLINNSSVFDSEDPELINNSRNISNNDTIHLTYKDRVITFEFSTDNYSNPDKVLFEYKLEKFDNQWTLASADNRHVTYTNLPGGKYIFNVRVAGNNTENNQAKIFLTVKPPLWKTLWFRSISIILIAILIVYIYLRRVRKINKKNIELSRLVDDRTVQLKNKNILLEENQKFVLEQSEEIKATNEQLLMLNATKDKLFSIIGHDLKNPINLIMGYSQLLQAKISDLSDDKRLKYITSISNSAKDTYLLLENLLSWAKSQNNMLIFKPEKLNLLETISDNIKILSEQCYKKEIEIIADINEDIFVSADIHMLDTILRNLLTNSVKYSDNKSTIEIKAEIKKIEQKVQISVKDHGIGIPKNNINSLFKIDSFIISEGTAGEKGTGLGLILCKEFIEQHNESIWVESIPGKGSTFRFTLSLCQDE